MLAAPKQFNSYCLLRFVIISNVHATFSIFLRKSLARLDTGIVKMSRKFKYWLEKNLSYKKRVFLNYT